MELGAAGTSGRRLETARAVCLSMTLTYNSCVTQSGAVSRDEWFDGNWADRMQRTSEIACAPSSQAAIGSSRHLHARSELSRKPPRVPIAPDREDGWLVHRESPRQSSVRLGSADPECSGPR